MFEEGLRVHQGRIDAQRLGYGNNPYYDFDYFMIKG
jgi:hypothetical protein